MEKQKRFVTPREAATIYGFAEGTLANLRSSKRGCRYYKAGRKILYDLHDFEDWITSHPVLTIDSIS